jgi:adenosine deaminase
VGIDLAGDEMLYPARPFAPLFRRASEAGLGITVHAGEAGGPENVREAIEDLCARRIGHGIRAIEDSTVVQLIRQRNVTLEVCPTSNLQTGVMPNFGHHPLRDLYLLRVPVTVNTDDPSVSDTTLTDEYLVAVKGMGLGLRDLRTFNRNAIRASFVSPEERLTLEKQILGEFDQRL